MLSHLILKYLDSGSIDGVGSYATFNNPTSLDIDRINKFLYIADTSNDLVRKVDITRHIVKTVARNIGSPMGIAYDDSASVLYVCSNKDNIIYSFSLIGSNAAIDASSSSQYILAGKKGIQNLRN